MCATCFGLYLGHPQACQYKNLVKKDEMKSKGPLVYSHYFLVAAPCTSSNYFTYFSPTIRSITNLFKHSNLNIAFMATNTVQQQLTEKPINKNPSGIYKLKCNTCNNVYVIQSGRPVNIRHKEHIRYTQTNNPQSAYALHILQNRHEFGPTADTLQLLQTCSKGTHMNRWEALYTQVFRQHKILITEQQVSHPNPLYELVNTQRILPRNS